MKTYVAEQRSSPPDRAGGGDQEDEDRRPPGPVHGPRAPEPQGPPGQAGGVLRGGSEGRGHAGVRGPPGGQARYCTQSTAHLLVDLH